MQRVNGYATHYNICCDKEMFYEYINKNIHVFISVLPQIRPPCLYFVPEKSQLKGVKYQTWICYQQRNKCEGTERITCTSEKIQVEII